MIDSGIEYQKMAEAEEHLWWYKILHERVLESLEELSPSSAILDIGCGTGGCLNMLQQQGFTNCSGIDLSEHALEQCKRRKVNARKGDLHHLNKSFSDNTFQALICNDAIYFAKKEQRKNIYAQMCALLETEGILLLNVPVYDCFQGIHDLSVGIRDRIQPADFFEDIRELPLEIQNFSFWPFFLSPLIFLQRAFQRLALKRNPNTGIKSDVDIPPQFINSFLFHLCRLEKKLLPHAPFGSSMFIKMVKE